jgi:NADH-quinone oxidoreductase subunit N
MSGRDIMSLLPIIILAGGMLFTMVLIAVKRSHVLTFISTLTIVTASFISALCLMSETPRSIGELLLIDRIGLYYQALIMFATFFVTIFSYINIRNFFLEKRKEEYYLLLILAALGAAMMVICTHFISFFVSLELLTISLYTLIAYFRERTKAIEAGLKYLMLAATSSAFLLFGMALIYAVTGTMAFHLLGAIAPALSSSSALMLMAGAGMMIVGIGFKTAVAPFHMWTPDVYEGASSPVSAFIATVSKGAMIAFLLRFFSMTNLYSYDKIMMVFVVISILSMLVGNLLALWQNNVKRILAYSSITHFGYILVAFTSGKEMGPQAATFYMTAYILSVLGAFGLITLISRSDAEASHIGEYKGLFWKRPLLAAIFTIILLSLAGMPLTAIFIGKFFLLTAGIGKAKWLLSFTLVAGSVIGLYYYLRLIVIMMKQGEEANPMENLSAPPPIAGILALSVLVLLLIGLGVCPNWLVYVIHNFSL